MATEPDFHAGFNQLSDLIIVETGPENCSIGNPSTFIGARPCSRILGAVSEFEELLHYVLVFLEAA